MEIEKGQVCLERQISGLKKFVKELSELRVENSVLSSGKVNVKIGKFISITAPDKRWATMVSDGFIETILKAKENANSIIKEVEKRCEQLTLELFGGDDAKA